MAANTAACAFGDQLMLAARTDFAMQRFNLRPHRVYTTGQSGQQFDFSIDPRAGGEAHIALQASTSRAPDPSKPEPVHGYGGQ
ncbi:MAG TPA: hypothetical protein VIW78_00525 [Burkholderiales bacterium]